MSAIPLKQYRDKIVAEAASEIGYTEGKNNWNKFAEELGASWVQNQAWCGTFNTAIYRRAGIRLEKIISNPYYVPTMVKEAKKKGIYTTNPEPGDLTLCDWQGETWDGDHTEVYQGNGYSIGGNTSPTSKGSQGNGGGVWRRKRSSSDIIGYISLAKAYEKFPQAFGVPSGNKKFEIWETNNTIKSMTRTQVKDLQTKLVKAGFSVGSSGIDGSYKKNTVEGVLAFQKKYGLAQDGIAGPATQKKLNEVLKPAASKPAPAKKPAPSKSKAPAFPLPKGFVYGPAGGDVYQVSGRVSNSRVRSDVVKDSNGNYYSKGLKVWQAQMKKRGWNLEADGKFGPVTEEVAKTFKKNKKGWTDAMVGPETWKLAWDLPVTN